METFKKPIFETTDIRDEETSEITGSEYVLDGEDNRIITGEEDVKIERWGWKVLFKPTDVQIHNAKIATEEKIRNHREEIMKLAKEYDATTIKFVQSTLQKKIDAEKDAMLTGVKPEQDILLQFDRETGKFTPFDMIEQDRIDMFSLVNMKDSEHTIDVVMQEGMKPIHFYRNVRPYYLKHFVRVYVIGYKIPETKVQNFTMVLPNNSIISTPIDNIDLTKFNLT